MSRELFLILVTLHEICFVNVVSKALGAANNFTGQSKRKVCVPNLITVQLT